MARIRTIKPEFWADEKLAPMSPVTRLVFLALISMADDKGRVLDSVKQIDAFMFPFDDDSSTCRRSLDELSLNGRIRRGETASGQRIIELSNWHHQKIDKPNFLGCYPDILQEVTPIRRNVDDESTTDRRHVVPVSVSVPVSVPVPVSGADASAPRPEKVTRVKTFPHFPDTDRKAAHDVWTSKRGPIGMAKLTAALGPCWSDPTDATRPSGAELLKALSTYCTLVGAGRSAPFAKIDRAAELLIPLTATHREMDRIARYDAAFLLIHGHAPQRVAA